MYCCRKECDSKVKAVEKAEVEVEKPKPGAKPKEIERAKKNLIQTRQSAEKANENYKLSVASLEASRHVWVKFVRFQMNFFTLVFLSFKSTSH